MDLVKFQEEQNTTFGPLNVLCGLYITSSTFLWIISSVSEIVYVCVELYYPCYVCCEVLNLVITTKV